MVVVVVVVAAAAWSMWNWSVQQWNSINYRSALLPLLTRTGWFLSQWQRLINNAYYDGMDALSKVTKYVRGVYDVFQPALDASHEESPLVIKKKDLGFEDLGMASPPRADIKIPEKVLLHCLLMLYCDYMYLILGRTCANKAMYVHVPLVVRREEGWCGYRNHIQPLILLTYKVIYEANHSIIKIYVWYMYKNQKRYYYTIYYHCKCGQWKTP